MKIINPFLEVGAMITEANGHYLRLENGKMILDFSLGSGVHLFGHSYKPLISHILECFGKNQLHGCFTEAHLDFTKKLELALSREVGGVVFCNSGTEATQRAIRYSRQASDKDQILCFRGNWHGMNESTLIDDGSRLGVEFRNIGIPRSYLDSSRLVCEFGDHESFERILSTSTVGTVIIEAIPGAVPTKKALEFVRHVLTRCHQLSITTIVDEIITGFRVNTSGVCGTYELFPDMITYGKVIGGGYPIGLVVLSEQFASKLLNKQDCTILTGGTFSANPVAVKAATATLDAVNQVDYAAIDFSAQTLRQRVNEVCLERNVPIRLTGLHSISRLVFTDKAFQNRTTRELYESKNTNKYANLISNLLKKHNVLIPRNGLLFTCIFTSEIEISSIANAFASELDEI